MGQILVFTVQSSLVMLAMYLVYKLLLSGMKGHGYNRVLLLSIYVLSPAVVYVADRVSFSGGGDVAAGTDGAVAQLLSAGVAAEPQVPIWAVALLGVWIAGMVAVGLSTLWSWMRIRRVLRSCELIERDGYRIALSDDENLAPFSLKRTAVISRKDYAAAGDIILAHERCHISCRHWIDLWVSRVAIVLAWFNPVVWLMQDELKSVHEYQADSAVLGGGVDARSYQLLLIKKAVGRSFPAIANSLNHSNLKKRITMMMKSESSRGRWWRSLALAPAVAVALSVTNLPAVEAAMCNLGKASLAGDESQREITAKSSNKKTVNVNRIEISKDSGGSVVRIDGVDMKDVDKVKGGSDENVTLNVDGVEMAYKEIGNISADDIAEMTVQKTDGAKVIHIKTKGKGDKSAATHIVPPKFPGGDEAFNKWIGENIRYPKGEGLPESAQVVVSFTVTVDGEVTNPKILRGAAKAYDDEALRLVGELPRFTPGTQDGKPMETSMSLPLFFVSQKQEK